MSADLYQIVTFATDPLRGNPAFVLGNVGDASDASLAGVCEMLRVEVVGVLDHLDETEPSLRFFTPDGPHPGAGHVTLAAAHVALRHMPAQKSRQSRQAVTFRTANGERREARATGERIAISYPKMAASRVELAAQMQAALGARPTETWDSAFGQVAIFEDAGTIAALQPDLARVGAFGKTAVIATSPGGTASDIAIRVFAPNVGLPEDPVCGTAHRILVPYWAGRLAKTTLHSRHLSPRGGDLWCSIAGDDVVIAGESRLVIEGRVQLPDR